MLQEWDLTGQNLHEFSQVVQLSISDKDFYRVEVESEKSSIGCPPNGYANEERIGFAFSNPIWVEKAEKANDVVISNITVNSDKATVKKTFTGNYYIDGSAEGLSADSLSITLAGDSVVTAKSFDAKNNLFNVVIAAEDGTEHEMVLYVASNF